MFSVALSVVDMLPAGVSLTSSVAIVEIIDNDEALVLAVELGFDPVTYRVGEGSGTVELRVSVLSGDLTEPITLNYETSDGSAVAGDDYALTTGTLTLSSGMSSFTFTVKILEDLDNVDVELAGVFSVALSVVDMLPAGVSLTSSVAIVEIIDNDEALVPAVVVGFDPVTYRVGEGSGTVELRVSVLSGDLTEPLTLNYETSDGSAVAGDDYALTTGTLTLSSGISSFTFTVKILEDLDNVDVELAGVFSVALSVVDMLPAGVSLTSSVAIVEIIDNDETLVPAVELGFDPVTYRVGEGSGTVELRVSVLSGVLMETITLSYETSDGSAVAGDDYALTTGTLTLSSGISSFTFTIKILEDLDNVDVELAGVFSVALSVVDMLPVGVSLTSSVAIVEIIDNDQPAMPALPGAVTATLSLGSVTLEEGDTERFEIRLNVNAPVDLTFTLDYVGGGSAEVGDYSLSPTLIVIVAGADSVTVAVTVVDDSVAEVEESFELRLNSVLPSVAIAPTGSITVTILESDQPAIVRPEVEVLTATLSLGSVTLEEGDTERFEIRLTGNAPVDLTFTLDYVGGGSAEVGDYSLSPTLIVIVAGADSVTVAVTVVDDSVAEVEESFELRLNSVLPSVAIAPTGTITVTILENDQPVIVRPEVEVLTATLSLGSVALEEGDTERFEIRLNVNAPVDLTFTLDYVGGGSAEVGDYSLSPTLIVIVAGADSVTVAVTVVDDSVAEVEESFELRLNSVLPSVAIAPTGSITVTILESDQPVIVRPEVEVLTATLSLGSVTLEEGDTERFEIRLTGNAPVDLTFTLDYVGGGSAEVGDYSLSPTLIVIVAGADSVTVAVTVVDDSVAEVEESFELRLNSVLPSVAIAPTGTITVTILENDQPVIVKPEVEVLTATLSLGSVTLEEGDTERFEIRLSVNAPVDLTFTLDYVGGGSAEVGDYSLSPTLIVIVAGADSVTVAVTVVDDSVAEVEESFELRLNSVLPSVAIAPTGTITVTIPESDQPVIVRPEVEVLTATLSLGSVTLEEGDTERFEIRLSVNAPVDLTFTLDYVGGGSAEVGDYSLSPTLIVIVAGADSVTVAVTVVDDSVAEVEESFELRLNSVLPSVAIAPTGSITVTILESDQPVIVKPEVEVLTATLSLGSVTLEEGDTERFEIRLSVNAPVDLTFTLDYVGGGSAEVGDYSLSPTLIVIVAGADSVTVAVTVVDDSVAEVEESFELRLNSVLPSVAIAPTGSITVTIPESDQPTTPVLPSAVTATLSLGSVTLEEGDTERFEIRLNVNAPVDLTFTLDYVGGGSAEVGDYSLSPTVIVIGAGTDRVMVEVTAVDDTDAEPDEVFTLSLMSDPSSSLVMIGDPGSITITIPANDQPPEATAVEFVVTTASINEGDEYEIELRLVDSDGNALSHSQDIEVTLAVNTNSDTTLSAGEYLLDGEQKFSTMVTIPANKITGTVLFQSVDDNDDEPDKYITLRISAVDQVSWDVNMTLRINVHDDDDPPVVIGFDRDAYRVSEGSGSLTLTVSVISGMLMETVTLSYVVSDVSTTGSDDYTVTVEMLELSMMTPSVTISVDITDDTSYEPDEEFTVELSGAPAGITLDPATATVSIIDNDAVVIGFDRDAYRVSEGSGSLTLTVSVISGVLMETITLSYVVSDVSTTVSDDYTVTVDVLELSMMTPSVTISVDITEDATLESEEEFTVELSGAPVGVSFNPTRATVTIIDNDAVVIGFDRAAYRVSEGSGSLTLTVSVISGVLMETITLSYVVSDVSTTVSDDYTVTVDVLELSMMTPSVTISVDITEDATLESEEEFTVELSGAPVGVSFNPTRATVTIIDKDAVEIGFDSRTYRVNEGSGSLTLTVSVISGVLMETITLSYVVSDVSTTGSDDYTVTVGMLELSLMTPSVTISVDITDDTSYEPEEEFTVELIGAPVGVSFNPPKATVTIIDDDAVVIGFDRDAYSVAENAGQVILTVSVINGVLLDTVTLNFATSDGSAKFGTDYTLTTGTVTLSLMTPSVTFSVDIIDDPTHESAEEFTVELNGASAGITLDPAIATVTISANDQPVAPPPIIVVPPIVVVPPPPPPTGGGGGGGGGGGDDPDPVTVSLDQSEQTVDEGNDIEVTVSLSETSDQDITVILTASGGTADTDDHGLVMQEMTIEAGDDTAMFTISTTDDNIYEGNETLILRLRSSVDVESNRRESTITIRDNDPVPTLSLEEDNLSVREGSSVTIRARLSNVSAEAILVALILEGQTAMLGSDFPLPVEFSAEIAPGAEFAEFIISTVDDTIYEPIETVLLLLSVIEGNVTEGTLAGTLSISDDDPMPTLSIEAPDEIIEGTTELVTIRLSAMNVDPVTVRVSAGSDGNVSEDDYTLSATEVTIEPGQLEATVMLSVIDDGLIEISEILVLEVESDEFETVRHRVTIPGSATAQVPVDVDSEAESCDQSGNTCVVVEPDTYSEPLLLVVEEISEPTDDIPAPTEFMYLPGTPLWDIEFLLESDPNLVVSELDGRVRVNLNAPRALVDANGGTAMISIATLHKGSVEWELLETFYDQDSSDDETYHFYAYTTRFSYFTLVMLDEVVVEPPVEPVDPPPSSDPPVPLWLLASIVLGILVAIVLIFLVIRFRLRRKSEASKASEADEPSEKGDSSEAGETSEASETNDPSEDK